MTCEESAIGLDSSAPAAMKIKLFRSLFRGRDDVFARRFENQMTGKAGYAPACANEWVRGICRKPQSSAPIAPSDSFFR
jgi:hypothetical protein